MKEFAKYALVFFLIYTDSKHLAIPKYKDTTGFDKACHAYAHTCSDTYPGVLGHVPVCLMRNMQSVLKCRLHKIEMSAIDDDVYADMFI